MCINAISQLQGPWFAPEVRVLSVWSVTCSPRVCMGFFWFLHLLSTIQKYDIELVMLNYSGYEYIQVYSYFTSSFQGIGSAFSMTLIRIKWLLNKIVAGDFEPKMSPFINNVEDISLIMSL